MRFTAISRKLVLIFFALLFLCCNSYATKQNKIKLPAKAPKHYTTFVYNKTFAKRFGFDVKKSRKLTKGLFAVRYKMYIPPDQLPDAILPYDCSVDLFINSKMDVNYPEGDAPAGDFGTFNKQTAFSTLGLKRTPLDQITTRKINSAYNSLRFMFTEKRLSSYEEAHKQDGQALLDSYRRNMLPGIAVLHFVPGCSYFAEMKEGASFWLGKRNAKYSYKSKSGEYLFNIKSYNVMPIPVSKTFRQYAKFGYCINNNLNVDDGRKFYPKLYKNYPPDPDCYAFLPEKRGKS